MAQGHDVMVENIPYDVIKYNHNRDFRFWWYRYPYIPGENEYSVALECPGDRPPVLLYHNPIDPPLIHPKHEEVHNLIKEYNKTSRRQINRYGDIYTY